MHEHPVVQEYLKTYEGVASFKENLGKVFFEKGMLDSQN